MPKKITCPFCEVKFGCKQIHNHYDECFSEQNKDGYLISFFSDGISGKCYINYLIVGTKTRLKDIDKFLRDNWCECCKHDSNFDHVRRTVVYDNDNVSLNLYMNGNEPAPKAKLISDYQEGDVFIYEYDFRSTTSVIVEIVKKLEGKNETPDKKIDLIFRNDEPEIKCATNRCKNIAKYYICEKPYCLTCTNQHDNEEMKLTIVNSPRSGLCEYEQVS